MLRGYDLKVKKTLFFVGFSIFFHKIVIKPYKSTLGRRRPLPWGRGGWGKAGGRGAAAARGRGAEGGAAVLEPRPPPPVAVGPRGGRSTWAWAAAARGRGAEGGAAVTTITDTILFSCVEHASSLFF